jgi:hypothetical protein
MAEVLSLIRIYIYQRTYQEQTGGINRMFIGDLIDLLVKRSCLISAT